MSMGSLPTHPLVDLKVDHFPGKIMDETPVSFGWSDGKRLQFKRLEAMAIEMS
jgi:hypothetical protein